MLDSGISTHDAALRLGVTPGRLKSLLRYGVIQKPRGRLTQAFVWLPEDLVQAEKVLRSRGIAPAASSFRTVAC